MAQSHLFAAEGVGQLHKVDVVKHVRLTWFILHKFVLSQESE